MWDQCKRKHLDTSVGLAQAFWVDGNIPLPCLLSWEKRKEAEKQLLVMLPQPSWGCGCSVCVTQDWAAVDCAGPGWWECWGSFVGEAETWMCGTCGVIINLNGMFYPLVWWVSCAPRVPWLVQAKEWLSNKTCQHQITHFCTVAQVSKREQALRCMINHSKMVLSL